MPIKLEKNKNYLNLYFQDQPTIENLDAVIWAIGRAPNSDDINLKAVDIKTNPRGFIPVDKFQTTSQKNIYAIGDVTGQHELTPVAIAAGRRLSDRLFDGQKEAYLDYSYIPSVVFSHPPIGSVGLSEEAACDTYGENNIEVYTTRFTPMTDALSDPNIAEKTAIKIICEGKNQHVIGCHIFGTGSDEMLQGFAVAIKMGATLNDFKNTVAIHPTTAEEVVTIA